MKMFAISLLLLCCASSCKQRSTPHSYISKAELLEVLKPFSPCKELSTLQPLNEGYPYLDSCYSITISSKAFDSLAAAYGFYTKRIKSYNDSLLVVLAHTYSDNDTLARRMFNRITSKDEHMRHYFLMDTAAYGELKRYMNFKFNGDMYDYFTSQNVISPIKTAVTELVRERVYEYYKPEKAILTDTVYKSILYKAFRTRRLPNFYDERDGSARPIGKSYKKSTPQER